MGIGHQSVVKCKTEGVMGSESTGAGKGPQVHLQSHREIPEIAWLIQDLTDLELDFISGSPGPACFSLLCVKLFSTEKMTQDKDDMEHDNSYFKNKKGAKAVVLDLGYTREIFEIWTVRACWIRASGVRPQAYIYESTRLPYVQPVWTCWTKEFSSSPSGF